jgi:hypothetical protein
MKSNKEMTQQEFDYSIALKRMAHKMEYLRVELESAKCVGMQGVSKGALIVIENEMNLLRSAIYNGLKTVGK